VSVSVLCLYPCFIVFNKGVSNRTIQLTYLQAGNDIYSFTSLRRNVVDSVYSVIMSI